MNIAGGLFSYEVDLWGKQALAQGAASEIYKGSSFSHNAVQLSVSAATTQLYFNILALEDSLCITQDLVPTQENSAH